MFSKISIFWRLALSRGAYFFAFLQASVSFLPESECKSIADFRPVQAFRELFFRNVHKTLILWKIILSHFLTLNQAAQGAGAGFKPDQMIF